MNGVSKEDKILRAFDLNYAYGSCVGITRLERWREYDFSTISFIPAIQHLIILGFHRTRGKVGTESST